MSFEEEFPSLMKNANVNLNIINDISILTFQITDDNLYDSVIDKQRVKKAIYKLAIHFSDRELQEESIWLLKELGLE